MGRRFTAGGLDRINFAAAGLGGVNFQTGTMAVILNRISDLAAFETIVATNQAASGASACAEMAITNTDLLGVFNGSTTRTLAGTQTVGATCIVGFSKATGTTTPVGHRYVYSTNTWTHANMSGTHANYNATTSLTIGAANDSAGLEPIDAEIWAIAFWDGPAFSNGEFERLASRRWLDLGPTFYEEYSHGREVGDSGYTLGRQVGRATTRTGTTRGVLAAPPGWRPSIQRRRR